MNRTSAMMFTAVTENLQHSAKFFVFRQVMLLLRIGAPVVEFLAQFLVPNVVELRANHGAHGSKIIRRLGIPWQLCQVALWERPFCTLRCRPKWGKRSNRENRLLVSAGQLRRSCSDRRVGNRAADAHAL